MNKKSRSTKSRIPRAYKGIQVNFCKDPNCPNFGVPAKVRKLKSGGPKGTGRDTYTLDKKRYKLPHLICSLCNEVIPIRSNEAIHQEFSRISIYLNTNDSPSCPNPDCLNHVIKLDDAPKSYYLHGKTHSGSLRYKCKNCGKTFSVPAKTALNHKKPHLNRRIFLDLVTQSSLASIRKTEFISYSTIYGKIDWLYQRCIKFAASRENLLRNGLVLPKLYIGVDRQFYTVNWTNQLDKRNVVLHAIGSADNVSRYVFGIHLDFDPSISLNQALNDAMKVRDYDKDFPFRKSARIWLPDDFENAVIEDESILEEQPKVKHKISSSYDQAIARDDVESPDIITKGMQLPQNGVQVRAVYSIYAHFFYLKELLKGAEKLRFFMDQESGIRGACLSAFHKEIKERKCDAFFIKIQKKTDKERLRAYNQGRIKIQQYMKDNPGATKKEARLALLIKSIKSMDPKGKWNDRWLLHPFPTKKEPEKEVSFLTDPNDYSLEHKAWLYNKASTHLLDNFFQQLRRGVKMIERSFTTPSNNKRVWSGYAAYNPEMVVKLIEIFRVYYNFAKKVGQKITPAMRLGIAAGPVDINDILYGKLVSGKPIRKREKEIKEHDDLEFKKKKAKRDRQRYKEKVEDEVLGKTIFEEKDYRYVSSLGNSDYLGNAELQNRTVYLDTETTGLFDTDRIVEISIVDHKGKTLFNSLINPEMTIPKEVQKIHKISNKRVKNSPTIEMVEEEIAQIIKNKIVVIYNAKFDLRMLPLSILKNIDITFCCMREFARINGEWDDRFNCYKSVPLGEAS